MSPMISIGGVEENLPLRKIPLIRQHVLTVSLEDYFQGAAFRNILNQVHWSRFDRRVEQNTERTLELLASLQVKATFFVSTWLAERVPDLIKSVAAEGHEIASSGVTNRSFRELSEPELREEARVSRYSLEQLTNTRVRGYRVADHRLAPKDLWALRVLAEEGYDYDSSVSPSLRLFHDDPQCRFVYQQTLAGRTFWEMPLPSIDFAGIDVPIAGGNYFRQIPEVFMRRAVRSWIKENDEPFIFYFRIWDLDPEQPEITGAPVLSRIRHYRNAEKMPALLGRFLAGLQLVSISDYLGLPSEMADHAIECSQQRLVAVRESLGPVLDTTVSVCPNVPSAFKDITMVVPCFNETDSLSYLANALRQFKTAVADRYQIHFVFVDDGSRDDTWGMLQKLFGCVPDVQIVRHNYNQGVAAAILTGIRASKTELVCSMDCDCTYDPLELDRMMLLMAEGVDCVTASPYHPAGQVLNVPPWRLAISAVASRLYRLILGSKLHTFTSCFRVYRRERVLQLTIRESGFVGIAEILGSLHLQGGRIAEYPATLTFRVLGHSKMKVVRNTALHLRLLCRLAYKRVTRNAKKIIFQTTKLNVLKRRSLAWLLTRPKPSSDS